METINRINIKNRTYYFYNDIINIENFDSDMLKLDKKSYKDIGIYNIVNIVNIGITIKKNGGYKIINSANSLYSRITRANGYIEEINGDKYLIFDSTDENKKLLKKIMRFLTELWIKLKK